MPNKAYDYCKVGGSIQSFTRGSISELFSARVLSRMGKRALQTQLQWRQEGNGSGSIPPDIPAEEQSARSSTKRKYDPNDWTDRLQAQTKQVSEEGQAMAAETALSLYTGAEHAGIALTAAKVWDWNDPIPGSDSEALAQGCLRMCYVRFTQLRRLFRQLPTKAHDRHVSECVNSGGEPRSFTTGAFIHGGVAAVLNTTRHSVWTTRLLCSIIRSLCPDALFSNVFLHLNVPSSLHTDSHNHPSIDNTLVPLSIWSGGELWCETEDGTHRLQSEGPTGILRELVMPYIKFNSRVKHAVLPWHGDRFVLGTYHIRDEWKLSPADASFLQDLGFQLSSHDVAIEDPYLDQQE